MLLQDFLLYFENRKTTCEFPHTIYNPIVACRATRAYRTVIGPKYR